MRLRYRLALGVAGVAALGLSAFAVGLSDRAVKKRVAAVLAETLRAPCTFDSASFSFLEGLEVRGLEVLDPDDPLGPPLLTVESLHLDYAGDLLREGPRLTKVVLHGPRIRVLRRADGTLALASLVSLPETEPGPPW